MTAKDIDGADDTGLTFVPGDGAPMESESSYRVREQLYRRSEQYAAMQQRYPPLRFWIARCHPSDLVADPLPQSTPLQGASALHWERSHGES